MIVMVLAAFFDFRRLERRHAVGDRLDAGQRDGAAGERLEQQQDPDGLGPERHVVRARRDWLAVPRDDPAAADRHDRQGETDEQVGRDGEDVARTRAGRAGWRS